jgi:2-oxoglutarate ferredoxin oxidoreductase subunit alpha
MLDLNKTKVERYIISKQDSKNITDYKRYQLTDTGISPRAIPSWIDGVIYADSDEHTEEGHITEDAQVRTAMVEKRFRKKMDALRSEIVKPTAVNTKDADILLIGFGSTYGVLKEASESIKDKKIGFIHLSQVWPFPEQEVANLLSNAKKAVTVENNASGQLARLIRRETGIKVAKSILKFDGRPFDLDYLVERIKQEA